MKTHVKHQIATHNGIPVAAVVPYAEYLPLFYGKPGIAAEEEYKGKIMIRGNSSG